MKILFTLCVLFQSLVFEKDNKVFELTESNFKYEVLQNGIQEWMVLVHSPQCHHCVEFKPTFEQIAWNMKDKQVKFAEVNCETQYLLCEQLEVKRYPTMFFMKEGMMYEYQGRRNVDQIKTFVNNDWKGMQSLEIPKNPPPLSKQFIDGLIAFKEEVQYIYSLNGNYFAKFMLAFTIIVIIGVAVMFLVVLVMIARLGIQNRRKKQSNTVKKDTKKKLKLEQLIILKQIYNTSDIKYRYHFNNEHIEDKTIH